MNMLLQGNALLALAAAVLWGGGDFSGGMGVKSAGGSMGAALRVVLMSHAASFSVLVAVALLRGDAFPHGALLAWGIGAGVAGGAFADVLLCGAGARSDGGFGGAERAAGGGDSGGGVDEPEGSPGMLRMVGFLLAGVAIWLIAAGENAEAVKAKAETVWLAVAAGVGFGIYFVALKFAGRRGLVWPMATARIGSLSVCSLILLAVTVRGGTGGVRITRAGGGVGAGYGGDGYVGEPAVYCGDAGGAAGCGGGAGVAVSGFDDHAGGVDAA